MSDITFPVLQRGGFPTPHPESGDSGQKLNIEVVCSFIQHLNENPDVCGSKCPRHRAGQGPARLAAGVIGRPGPWHRTAFHWGWLLITFTGPVPLGPPGTYEPWKVGDDGWRV